MKTDNLPNTGYHIAMIAAVDLPEGGGETTRLKTLVYSLKQAGNKVHILLENTSGNVNESFLKPKGDINGIQFEYILGNTKPLKGTEFFTGKAKAIRLFKKKLNTMHQSQKIDVIWFNMLAAHTIWPLTKWAKKRGIKVVHSYEDERIKGRGLKRRLIYANQWIADKYLTSAADAIVAISYYLKDKYEKLTSRKVPVVIIPTIVEPDKWFAGPPPDNKIPILLYYGSFYGFDEIELIIDAIKVLTENGTPVKLWLAGYNRKKPEYMISLQEYISSNDLDKHIEMKGFTPHDEIIEYIRQSDVLIGLRKDDAWSSTGLSTKLSEYLSTGRPIIATAIGDNTRYLTNGENAILMQPGCSASELSQTIADLISDKSLQNRIGAAGRKTAMEKFEVGVVAGTLREMLGEVCGK